MTMHVLRAAALCAILILAGAGAPPVLAQTLTIIPADKAEGVLEKTTRAQNAATRLTAMAEALDTASLSNAKSPEAYVARLDAMLPAIAADREELRRLSAELRALPRVAGPGDPPQVHAADRLALNVADLIDQYNDVLAWAEPLADAMRAGRYEEAMGHARRLGGGAVVMVEGQAVFFRGRAEEYPDGASDRHLALAVACLYDGSAAYARAGHQLQPPAEAAAAMRAASTCMTDNLARAEVGLADEADDRLPAQGSAVRSQLADIYRQMIALLRPLAPVLNSAANDAAKSAEGLVPFFDRVGAAEARMRQLAREQVAILDAQPDIVR